MPAIKGKYSWLVTINRLSGVNSIHDFQELMIFWIDKMYKLVHVILNLPTWLFSEIPI
jgi:hypothetical protein